MVRSGDSLDFGQWKGVDGQLVIRSTHIARISKNIEPKTSADGKWPRR